MPEVKKVSPLLDEFALGKPFSNHHGVVCYPAVHSVTNEKFILKYLSIPESQIKVDALLLTGACLNRTAAQNYYEELAQSMVRELQLLKDLSQTRAFAPIYDFQLTKKDNKQVGMDLWILSPYRLTLANYLRRGDITYLDAVNMGIDLCAALTLCRKAGQLYQNLRPENIFITAQHRFQLGDLGLLPLDELAFAMLPDRYRSAYTPPELEDTMAEPNATMDIYALGMVLYQVYNNGKLPEPGDKSFDGALSVPACADPEMAAIIRKAIARNKEDRWQSPEQMGQALVSYMQSHTVNDEPIAPPAAESQDTEESAECQTPATPPEPEKSPVAVPAGTTQQTDEPDFTPVPPEPELGFTPVEPDLGEAAEDEEPAVGAEPMADTEMEDILTRAESFMEEESPSTSDKAEPKDQKESSVSAEKATAATQEKAAPETDTANPEEESSDDEDIESVEDEEETAGQKRVFRRVVTTICVLVCLALAFMGGYFYYQNIYCIPVKNFDVLGSTLDTLTVKVKADGREDKLTISCQDAFGNAHPAAITDGQATFTDLQPNTQYIITLGVDGFHQLVGKTNLSFTTAILTEIADLTAVTGAEDGSVILSFTPNGTEPDAWFMTYVAEGEEEKTVTFTDHTVTITGLTVGKEYTFTLTADNDICLSGTDSLTHTAMAVVTAQNMTLSSYTGSAMTISWDEPETPVGNWSVRCYNTAGFDTTVQTQQCSVTLEDLDPSLPYSFEVTADGMTESTIFALTSNPVFISEIQTDSSVAGELTVNWSYVGSTPQKWLVMYSFGADPDQTVAVQTEEPVIKIDPALPGATYRFQIQPGDGSSVFNGTYETQTAKAASFDGFGITAANMTMTTFLAPEDPEWTTGEIDLENNTTTFKITDTIAFALEITAKYDHSDTEVETVIIIRDADGAPVDFTHGTAQWHTMWTNDLYLGQLQRTPQSPGEYTLEIYFNNQLASTQAFTITQ